MHNRAQIRDTVSFIACPTAGVGVSRASKQQCLGGFCIPAHGLRRLPSKQCRVGFDSHGMLQFRGPAIHTYRSLYLCGSARPNAMNPEPTPEQDKPDPFALDLTDDTPLPVICELSEDGTCEACQ